MKKTIIFSLFAVAVFSSCKKDYTCTCTTTINGIPSAPETITYTNVSKNTAETNCLSSTGTSGPAYTKRRECTLQ